MDSIVTQIYEVQGVREAEAVVALGVDRIGSVVLSQVEWKIPGLKALRRFLAQAGTKHSLIPLFSDRDAILRMLAYYEPDIVHFCESLVAKDGSVVPLHPFLDTQRQVKRRYPQVEVMRTIPVPNRGNLNGRFSPVDLARVFEEATDCYLVDTWLGAEPVEGFVGITGRICDWTKARRLVESIRAPVFLAGGLSPENVYDAIVAVRPFGVDSCTQTNKRDDLGRSKRFEKDLFRVSLFVEEVRRAERDLSIRSPVLDEAGP